MYPVDNGREEAMRGMSWKKRLFLSYIFVGVIPILVLGGLFYSGYRVSVEQEIEKNNTAMLSQAMQKMDYVTEKMNSASLHFSGTELAEQLDDVRNQKVDMEEGVILSQMETYSDIVSDTENPAYMMLYLRGDHYIYTPDGRVEYADFENEMNQYGDLNELKFYSTISSFKKGVSVKIGGKEQKKQNTITFFLYPVPYMNNIPVATLGFGLDFEAIKNMIKTYYNLDSMIFIFNDQLQNIFVYAPEGQWQEADMVEEQLLKYPRGGGRMTEEKANGKKYIVLREISANSGFTIVTVTRKDVFYRHENKFVYWYIFLIAVLFFCGVALSLMLSKNSYRPIQNLLEKVAGEDETAFSDAPEGNEFEILNSRWADIRSKNEELSILVNRQRPMVVASCLRRILKGAFQTEEEMEAAMKSAAIHLNYPCSFVILIPIPADEELNQEKNVKILSVLTNELHPSLHVYGLDMLKDDSIVAIVNCREKTAGPEKKDIRLLVANQLLDKLDSAYGIRVSLYIGRIYEKWRDISRSFIEACAIADDYKSVGKQRAYLFEEIAVEEKNIRYPILEQAVYIQCLKQANETAALKALDNMIQEIEPLKSFVITQCLCFDIINITIRTLDQMKGFQLENVDLKKICAFNSLSDFKEKTSGLVSEICRQFSRFKDNKSTELKKGILNYVNSHFMESSMGLEAVADEFGITANYLSRFFKQETGCTFIQYVTMIRMDRAKDLLINSEMPVKDVVAESGYIDVANFVRKFKNYEGVTPGQYREKMRKEL